MYLYTSSLSNYVQYTNSLSNYVHYTSYLSNNVQCTMYMQTLSLSNYVYMYIQIYVHDLTRNTVYKNWTDNWKELNLCQKLLFSNIYIFAMQCRSPLIFQTMNTGRSWDLKGVHLEVVEPHRLSQTT